MAGSSPATGGPRHWAGGSEAAHGEVGKADEHKYTLVLVVTAPPEAGLVASARCTVEPLIHAPERIHAARIGGVGVVDDAVFEHEGAHARSLAGVGGHVGSGRR